MTNLMYSFSMYLFQRLYMFRAASAHHQEGLGFLILCVISIYFYVDIARSYLFHSTYFVKPDGCIFLIQFYFDVLLFVYLVCLFSSEIPHRHLQCRALKL